MDVPTRAGNCGVSDSTTRQEIKDTTASIDLKENSGELTPEIFERSGR
jgi:hypothetical protein